MIKRTTQGFNHESMPSLEIQFLDSLKFIYVKTYVPSFDCLLYPFQGRLNEFH